MIPGVLYLQVMRFTIVVFLNELVTQRRVSFYSLIQFRGIVTQILSDVVLLRDRHEITVFFVASSNPPQSPFSKGRLRGI